MRTCQLQTNYILRWLVLSALLFVLLAAGPRAQAQVITEIIDSAGDGAGNSLNTARGIAVDGSGNVYVAGFFSHNAFKITPGGIITEIIDSAGDGVGNTLNRGLQIAVDGSGNVFLTAQVSDNAFKITPSGIITEIIDIAGDGAGNPLDGARGIAVDGSGNVYIAGQQSDNAFKITPGGVITEIIDSSGDGAGNILDDPFAIAVDGSGNVYVTGFFSDNAFKITPGGIVTEIIDSSGDGAGNTLDDAVGIAVDESGNVYVAGNLSDNAFKITPIGIITEIINSAGDGLGNALNFPLGFTADGSGNVYIGAEGSDNVFKITPGGIITEIIDSTGDGTGNTFDAASTIFVDGSGDVYVTGIGSSNAFKITLQSNQLPDCSGAAIAGQTANDGCGATISGADVTGVIDADGDALMITVSPTSLVLGANNVTVTANDGKGGMCSTDITVNVVDDTPSSVTADLVAVAGDDDDDNLFAVQCSATDNCDANPSLAAITQVPSLTNPAVEFKVKKHKKLKFDLKKNEVKVEGPYPQGLWAMVQNAGGVEVNDGQVLKLKVTGGQKHEFKFDKDGNLKEVKGPEAPTLVCTATDAAGNVSTETVSAVLSPDNDDEDDDKAHKFTANTLSSENLPGEFALTQNHPNPFNPTTTITFAVPEATEVTLTIYNLRGQLIRTLHSGPIAAGQHSVVWDGMDARSAKVSSGVYVYQLKANNFVANRKLVLMK